MESVDILLLDDGELNTVARLLEEQGLPYSRRRGADTSATRLAPPNMLLITTPRHAQAVRRGSPSGARAGRPVRIIAAPEDSTAMRRMLRRMGFHLLVRLPCDETIWRLLIRRALYHGDERREEPRVAMGAPVSLTLDDNERDATLMDISNRGCRLVGARPFELGSAISIELDGPATGDGPLSLGGHVARVSKDSTRGDDAIHAASVIFDEMDESMQVRLGGLINRWSMGPPSVSDPADAEVELPPCPSRVIPGLTLDDETDPAIRVGERVGVHLAETARSMKEPGVDRRGHHRGAFTGTVVATSDDSRRVLMGRDLSAGGMRIERLPGIELGDTFRLALYGPSPLEPFEVSARVIRDDGEEGLALGFTDMSASVAETLEKLVACLPEVESLEQDESHAMGAVLSEILDER